MVEDRNRVMVVVAHPDDAEFSCAGTMAKWAQEGREITYVICTNGDKGTSNPDISPERLAATRAEEQRRAAATLGVARVEFLEYPDGGLEDTLEFRGKIVRLIRIYRPDILVTMDPYRHSHQHRDHRMAAIVALDACFPYARDHLHYPEQMLEGLETHKVAEVYLAGAENPDTWVDITDTFDQKVAAIRCHESQIGSRPLEEMRERMREGAARVGADKGLALAEAFRRLEFRR